MRSIFNWLLHWLSSAPVINLDVETSDHAKYAIAVSDHAAYTLAVSDHAKTTISLSDRTRGP